MGELVLLVFVVVIIARFLSHPVPKKDKDDLNR